MPPVQQVDPMESVTIVGKLKSGGIEDVNWSELAVYMGRVLNVAEAPPGSALPTQLMRFAAYLGTRLENGLAIPFQKRNFPTNAAYARDFGNGDNPAQFPVKVIQHANGANIEQEWDFDVNTYPNKVQQRVYQKRHGQVKGLPNAWFLFLVLKRGALKGLVSLPILLQLVESGTNLIVQAAVVAEEIKLDLNVDDIEEWRAPLFVTKLENFSIEAEGLRADFCVLLGDDHDKCDEVSTKILAAIAKANKTKQLLIDRFDLDAEEPSDLANGGALLPGRENDNPSDGVPKATMAIGVRDKEYLCITVRPTGEYTPSPSSESKVNHLVPILLLVLAGISFQGGISQLAQGPSSSALVDAIVGSLWLALAWAGYHSLISSWTTAAL